MDIHLWQWCFLVLTLLNMNRALHNDLLMETIIEYFLCVCVLVCVCVCACVCVCVCVVRAIVTITECSADQREFCW